MAKRPVHERRSFAHIVPAGPRWDNEAGFGPSPDGTLRRYDGGVSILGVFPVRSRIELQNVNGAVESHLLDMRVDCEDPLRRTGRSGRRDVNENSIHCILSFMALAPCSSWTSSYAENLPLHLYCLFSDVFWTETLKSPV